MAWIESHQSLGHHPKLQHLARQLGLPLPTAVGHLHYLWWWAMDYAQDGDLSNYDAQDVADAALWPGDPATFVRALLDCGGPKRPGFLEATDNGIILHDWLDYVVRLLDAQHTYREANRQRQQAYRDRQRQVPVTPDVTLRVTDRNAPVTLRNAPTVPNPTVPDHTEPVPPDPPATPTTTTTTALQTYIDAKGGRISKIDRKLIDQAIATYTDPWVTAAIEEATASGAHSIGANLITTICNRWQTEGFKSPRHKETSHGTNRSNPGPTTTTDPNDRYAYERELLRRRAATPQANQ